MEAPNGLGLANHHAGLISLPAHMKQPDFEPGNTSSEDPLAAELPSSRSQSPPFLTQLLTSDTLLSPPERPRIAVMLNPSPGLSGLRVSAHFDSSHGGAHGAAEAPTQDRAGEHSPSKAPAYVPSGAASTASSRGRGRPRALKSGFPYNGDPTAKVIQATAAASRQARQLKPRQPPTGFPKRRGRPPKPPSPQPREIYCRLSTPFVAFLCEWRGCRAELHNLDTLRRHVNIVHGSETRLTCQWGKCGRKEKLDEFEDEEAWKEHMEEAHLVPFAWHIGDGPKNSSGTQEKPNMDVDTGDGVPDYLKDERGNQVTPSVKDQRVEDFTTWRNNRQRLRELLIRRDENMLSEESTDSEHAGHS